MDDVRTHAIMRKDFIYKGHHFVVRVITNFKYNSNPDPDLLLRIGWRHKLQIEHAGDEWKVEREIGDGDPIAERIKSAVITIQRQAEQYVDNKSKEDPVVKTFKELGFAVEVKGVQVQREPTKAPLKVKSK